MKKDSFITWFEDLRIGDVPKVGGKNAALGEMIFKLKKAGISVPGGFAVTAGAYRHFLVENKLDKKIGKILKNLNVKDIKDLRRQGKRVRELILSAKIPKDLESEIRLAYKKLEKKYGLKVDVATRSSATAEDLPNASFAGQQETFLNIRGINNVLLSVRKCMASLFTDRAISYREDKGFSHMEVALSVGVQRMVRGDLASSGVMFSVDTETGFDKVVVIDSTYGLGEILVGGKITPDEFSVFKPALKKGFSGIIAKDLGKKKKKAVYGKSGIKYVGITRKDQRQFSINDKEVEQLARWAVDIEEHFKKPMDIEWAKDGKTGELFILQARPETVHNQREKNIYYEYRLKDSGKKIIDGIAIGSRIASGKARVIENANKIESFKKGEVLVTDVTDPDWEPIMKIAKAIVTNKGGRTSHAAIVSRELGIPAIVGAGDATEKIKTGQVVTVDCSSGKRGSVYEGSLKFVNIKHNLKEIPKTKTKVMVNIGSPDEAFKNHYLPTKGVGLGRLEFIIGSHIGIHPNALINFDRLKNKKLKNEIEKKTPHYKDKKQFYIDELAEGIAKIASIAWPNEAIIRFSDFKTNEYSNLLGGSLHEPEEANPMIGWRGASRYYHENFKKAFGLECLAVRKAREEMGLDNVVVMVPFCRTIKEGERVLEVMKEHGLDRGVGGEIKKLKVYMMCEIPSNVVLASDFLKIFDGLSIGSNDLTQLILGLDRDAGYLSYIGDENNLAVKKMIGEVIKITKSRKKYIGICGQAPSDFPDFAGFLVKEGIDSISLNPEAVIKILPVIKKYER